MKQGDPVALRAATRALSPILFLVGAGALARDEAGADFAAGVLFALAFVAHALIFGVAAARRAAPQPMWRALGALAIVALALAACAPDWPYAARLAACATAALCTFAVTLAFLALSSRASFLREEDW